MSRWFVVWVILLVGLAAAGAEERPDALAAWVDSVVAGVAQSGCQTIGAAELAGEAGVVGRYVPVRLEAGLTKAALGRWQVISGSSLAVALRAANLKPDQLTDPELVGPAVAELKLDGLLTGTARRDGDLLRIELQLVRPPHGPVTNLPSAELPLDGDLLALGGLGYAVDEQRGVRPKRLEAVQLALSRGEGPPPVLDPACPFRLEILVDGHARRPEQRGREAVVKVQLGDAYTLRLTNRSRERMGVALFIDGLNTVGQQRELPSAGLKWLVDAGQSLEVQGWQVNLEERRGFAIGRAEASVAGQRGLTDQLGLITASFYAAAEAARVGGEERRGDIGTIEQTPERSSVTQVEFKAAETPAATLVVRYEMGEPAMVGR